MAEAPVPITATRLPVRSTSCFHCAVWNSSPWKSSRPSISGSFGSESPPAQESSVREENEPLEVSTSHRCDVPSQLALCTVVSKTKRSSVPDPSATRRM